MTSNSESTKKLVERVASLSLNDVPEVERDVTFIAQIPYGMQGSYIDDFHLLLSDCTMRSSEGLRLRCKIYSTDTDRYYEDDSGLGDPYKHDHLNFTVCKAEPAHLFGFLKDLAEMKLSQRIMMNILEIKVNIDPPDQGIVELVENEIFGELLTDDNVMNEILFGLRSMAELKGIPAYDEDKLNFRLSLETVFDVPYWFETLASAEEVDVIDELGPYQILTRRIAFAFGHNARHHGHPNWDFDISEDDREVVGPIFAIKIFFASDDVRFGLEIIKPEEIYPFTRNMTFKHRFDLLSNIVSKMELESSDRVLDLCVDNTDFACFVLSRPSLDIKYCSSFYVQDPNRGNLINNLNVVKSLSNNVHTQIGVQVWSDALWDLNLIRIFNKYIINLTSPVKKEDRVKYVSYIRIFYTYFVYLVEMTQFGSDFVVITVKRDEKYLAKAMAILNETSETAKVRETLHTYDEYRKEKIIVTFLRKTGKLCHTFDPYLKSKIHDLMETVDDISLEIKLERIHAKRHLFAQANNRLYNELRQEFADLNTQQDEEETDEDVDVGGPPEDVPAPEPSRQRLVFSERQPRQDAERQAEYSRMQQLQHQFIMQYYEPGEEVEPNVAEKENEHPNPFI